MSFNEEAFRAAQIDSIAGSEDERNALDAQVQEALAKYSAVPPKVFSVLYGGKLQTIIARSFNEAQRELDKKKRNKQAPKKACLRTSEDELIADLLSGAEVTVTI